MNEIVNKFLLADDKFMLEMPVDHLLETKKEYKNVKKQDIHDIFIKTT